MQVHCILQEQVLSATIPVLIVLPEMVSKWWFERFSARNDCRVEDVKHTQFPVQTYARVRCKGAASKLRVRKGSGFEYGMEVLFGDATLQIAMTIHSDVIESHFGKFCLKASCMIFCQVRVLSILQQKLCRLQADFTDQGLLPGIQWWRELLCCRFSTKVDAFQAAPLWSYLADWKLATCQVKGNGLLILLDLMVLSKFSFLTQQLNSRLLSTWGSMISTMVFTNRRHESHPRLFEVCPLDCWNSAKSGEVFSFDNQWHNLVNMY